MHRDADRLFSTDQSLRKEADTVLVRSGIGEILQDGGYRAVGSYAMRTMTWRDLDFERYTEPDWAEHWEVGTKLAETGWCVRLQCVDVYREQWQDYGLYWGLRVADPNETQSARPGDPKVWKLDLWTARPEEFAPAQLRRETWASLMSDEARSYVLAIKEAVCDTPEYRKGLLSVHIYEGVLEEGIRDLKAFREWWAGKYGEPEAR